jgi:hypothetical protein
MPSVAGGAAGEITGGNSAKKIHNQRTFMTTGI